MNAVSNTPYPMHTLDSSARSRAIGPVIAGALVALALVQPLHAQTPRAPLSAAAIAQRASPATVTIIAISANGDTLGQGSGFLVRATGEIITNHHVLAGASRAIVRLASGERYDRVQAIDADSLADLAIIKVAGFGLPVVPLASTTPPVGSHVVVIGSPLGLSQTVSDGLISAVRLYGGKQQLQISAPISHGSSGGPVFNDAGEVIGVAAASIESGQQLNFAVPIKYALGMLAEHRAPQALGAVFAGAGEGSTAADRSLASEASTTASGRARSDADWYARRRAVTGMQMLTRPNPPRAARPVTPFAGTFFVLDSLWAQSSGRGDLRVLAGVAYIARNGVGVAAMSPVFEQDTLGDARYLRYLGSMTATADGRLGLAGIALGETASAGYQTGDGAFFTSAGRIDTVSLSSRIHLQRTTQSLTEKSGLFVVNSRTFYTAKSYRAPDPWDWDGDLIVIDGDKSDAYYVQVALYNTSGGKAGFSATGHKTAVGTIIAYSDDWSQTIEILLADGRVSGNWSMTYKEGGQVSGSFTGGHP